MSHPEIPTQVARSGYHEHLFAGQRVFAELGGQSSLAGLIALGVTGRRLADDEAALLDDLATVWTVADARIWPMKVARLVASHGGTLEGLAAGFLAFDCTLIGMWAVIPRAAELLIELGDADEEALLAIVRERARLPGFGTPFRSGDERLPPLDRCVELRGRHERPTYRRYRQLAATVLRERELQPNIAAAAAAIFCDLGWSPAEIGAVSSCLGVHMLIAHAHEGAQQRAAVAQRLPPSALRFEGPAPRRSPRAAGGTK